MKLLILIIAFLSQNSFAQHLKIMTYNIRLDVASDGENAWPKRKDFLISQLKFYEPDIFGIQEALPNQVGDLSNNLVEYNFIGVGRDENNSGESSNIFYKKEKFQVLENKTFWLSETPKLVSKGWDAALNRVCTYGLFKNKFNGKKFFVFNTHFDHIGEIARDKSIDLILSKIKSLNKNDLPVIFMGDLNSVPEKERIKILKTKMFDAAEISIEKPFGPDGTFNGFNYLEIPKEIIDYVFVSKNKNIKVYKYAILTDSKNLKFPSDHFPVFVELSF